MKEDIINDVNSIWNYLCLKSDIKPAECIIGLGSILESIPKKCAELYKQGFGKYIVFSGNCGKGTEGVISDTEAEIFKKIAINEGVPEDKIFTENQATNTYENFKYIKKLLIENNLDPKSFLIVGKPYQERRANAIANIELPNKEFNIASFKMDLTDFLTYVQTNNLMSIDDVINELVGEINIAILTPKFGLQTKEEIPNNIKESYNKLVKKGYNRYLLNDNILISVITKWKNLDL